MKSFEKSIAAFEEAKQHMPGGVNSPVRAFRSVGMDPIFMDNGKGSRKLQTLMAIRTSIMY